MQKIQVIGQNTTNFPGESIQMELECFLKGSELRAPCLAFSTKEFYRIFGNKFIILANNRGRDKRFSTQNTKRCITSREAGRWRCPLAFQQSTRRQEGLSPTA